MDTFGTGNGNGSFTCPEPFIDPASLDRQGGYIKGRMCHDLSDDMSCCLPCPMTDWVYDDNFEELTTISGWVSVVATAGLVFLCLSWAFLPVKQTSRHYLSICLAISIIILNLGFILPLAVKPDQCYDAITPNDMRSDGLCAFTGACIHYGGWAGVMWLFLRSLSLHLQICWGVEDGRKFMLWSFVAGWGIPIIAGTVVMVLSGVSYRFGSTCFSNHVYSMEAFWIPLLIFIGMAVVIALATLMYCVKVYVAVLSASEDPSRSSISTMTLRVGPREIYRRTRRVFAMQWRGIAVVTIILASVVFYAVVFAFQDSAVRSITHSPHVALDWGLCLMTNLGKEENCLHQVDQYVVNKKILVAVLILLSFNGLWLLIFLGRWSMIKGWVQLFRQSTGNDVPEMTMMSNPHRCSRCSRCDDNHSYRVTSKISAASDWPLTSPPQTYIYSPNSRNVY